MFDRLALLAWFTAFLAPVIVIGILVHEAEAKRAAIIDRDQMTRIDACMHPLDSYEGGAIRFSVAFGRPIACHR
jgi:hypothetical protein